MISAFCLAELLGEIRNLSDQRAIVFRFLPVFVGRLQLGVQGPAHRLAEEADARLGLFAVHAAAADGVLDLFAHGLLDRIDGDGRCGSRLGFAVGGEDVVDHLVLQNEHVLVADVARLVRQAGDQLGDLVAVLLDLVALGVDVAPEMALALASRARGLEVEEHAVALLSAQPRVNAVRQLGQGIRPVPVEQVLQLLEQHLGPGQFGPGFFFVQHCTVLVTDAPERVEGPRMHDFTEDAGIEQAQVVDGRDAVGEALDQVQQRLQFGLGEQVVNADLGVRAADAVDAAIALDEADRVPGQVVVDDEAAVLKVLPFRQNVRADENVDLSRRVGSSLRSRPGRTER